jgi:hypothetical protein
LVRSGIYRDKKVVGILCAFSLRHRFTQANWYYPGHDRKELIIPTLTALRDFGRLSIFP